MFLACDFASPPQDVAPHSSLQVYEHFLVAPWSQRDLGGCDVTVEVLDLGSGSGSLASALS
jgi:methylase of polypeptide subunit release factors